MLVEDSLGITFGGLERLAIISPTDTSRQELVRVVPYVPDLRDN